MVDFIKKKKIFIVILFVFQFSLIFSKEIILGGKNGWQDFESTTNLTTGKGRFGYDCIQLDSNSFVPDEETDLLINFENKENPILLGDYEILSNGLTFSENTQHHKLAGFSRNLGGLELQGKKGSFFGDEGLHGSFSLEFWLNPSIVENGEEIFNWESSLNYDGQLIYQLLKCSFHKGHFEWNISNFFHSFEVTNINAEVKLTGTSKIIPNSWSYHVLSFNAENGLLEYIVNGITEDLTYITSDKTEKGEVSLVTLGTVSKVEICNDYTGLIDEIRLIRRPYSPPSFQTPDKAGKIGHTKFIPNGGNFVSNPIMISYGAKLNSLVAEMNKPEQTEIYYYIRYGENQYNWTKDFPKWIEVKNGEELKDAKGLYFQVAAQLFPDGNGEITPTITQIKLDFTELPEPLPPFVVRAIAKNQSVTLNWNYSVDENAGGYFIYYGLRPGEYLGRFANEGNSPIDVGKVNSYTITGLENGKIYYFSVASKSEYDERIIGPLSKEVFARPVNTK